VPRHRSAGLALLLIFLAAHLALLPRTLEDLDSINFALGVRHFDVAQHQPHPPGYPVYIAAAKASTATLRFVGFDAAAPRGLAIWSALAGAAALPALFVFFRRLEGRAPLAVWEHGRRRGVPAVLVLCAPPADRHARVRGLDLGHRADGRREGQARPARRCAARRVRHRHPLADRVLTLPMLLMAMFRGEARQRIGAIGAFAAGVLLWAVPLIAASGGVSSYLEALGAQAGEDFSGVLMLYTAHSRRESSTRWSTRSSGRGTGGWGLPCASWQQPARHGWPGARRVRC
jgi:hypothetical protein